MPSEKILSAKKELVANLNAKLSGAAAGVLVDYKGITVANDTKLRAELRAAGVEYSVVKNTMVRFALEGTGYEELASVLEGTTALAISVEDPIAPAKILGKYAEESKGAFSIKAGFCDGKVLNQAEVEQLAKLPNREGLLSMLLSALTGNLRGLACAINAIAEKMEAPAEEAAAE
jgi:large subunit ribosomal protein L10